MCGMGKVALWVGAGLLLAGVALGFVKDGVCGSVFDPRDAGNDAANESFARVLGNPALAPPDCSTATDYTVPVWLLIGVGGATLLVGGLVLYGAADDRRQAEERARRHARLNPPEDASS